MRGTIAAYMFNAIKRKTVVELEIEGNVCEQLQNLEGRVIEAAFKIFREKRSMSANAYAWVLINKLSEAMSLSAREIYREHIKEMGVYRDVPVDENAENTLKTVWEAYGLGWFAERVDFAEQKGFVILRLWYGSSVYNTKQMSRFIDSLVQDCKALGIETMTPEQIHSLIVQSEEMRNKDAR